MECRHHPTCPGCPLLEKPYEEQLAWKGARLAAAWARYPHLPGAPAVEGSPWTEGYRHRLKLPVRIAQDHVSIGLYDRSGREVLDTPDCPVLAPALREGLASILGWMRGRRGIHALDLRVSAATGELQAVFACDGGDLPGGGRAARALLAAAPKLASVAVSRADPDRKKVMGAAPRVIAGRASIDEAIGESRYRLHPGAFFQVDPRRAARLHELTREYVGGARRVLDLYSGVGAYAVMLARGGAQVTAVEEFAPAAASAEAVAPPGMRVVCARAEELPLDERFDCVVLNPARRGSDPGTLARVARAAPRAVYVSCGPETLARDLDILAAHGLRVVHATALDLFPGSTEVEAVVLLERGPRLVDWPTPGGRAGGPWHGDPSGARGRPSRALALVIGDPGQAGSAGGSRWRRIAVVATHGLVRIDLAGPLAPVLSALARAGHPTAGHDPRTRRFFAEKAGLVRPFVHLEVAGKATAPLHGDLEQALVNLGADARVLARAAAVSRG